MIEKCSIDQWDLFWFVSNKSVTYYSLVFCICEHNFLCLKHALYFGNGHGSEKTEDLDIETSKLRPDAAAYLLHEIWTCH